MVNIKLFLILTIPFLLYHNNQLTGPDGEVYLAVAHSIVTKGTLNILPETPSNSTPLQITHTHHAPIHQNIGGVLFIVPATVLTLASHSIAQLIPNLPPRFYDISYHEGLWLGCVTYLLAMLTCLLIYKVALCYYSSKSAIAALLACVFGGPLFLYAAIYPCNTNLPAAFLSSLLLYVYHFADMKKQVSWMLLGALLGLGVFARHEFVVWLVLLLYAIFRDDESGFAPWSAVLKRTCYAACGILLFIIPTLLIRQILYGHLGSTYSIQVDLMNLSKAHLMLWGPRNGLFVLWPVLLIALMGYFFNLKKNTSLHHLMFIILVLVGLISGTIIFWNGELGHSIGQRWFLVVFPVFVLYLSRLFDLSKRYFGSVLAISVACTVWALSLWAAYGMRWSFPNNVTGFLMPHHFSPIFSLLTSHYSMFSKQILLSLLYPKHMDAIWLFPLFSAAVFSILWLGKMTQRTTLFKYLLLLLVMISLITTGFLAGAGKRGEMAYNELASHKQATFIIRNYEVNFEIVSSMVDSLAFFMESGDHQHARYIKNKTLSFLQVEAPDQVDNFIKSCDALELRQSLGWYRLFPEQIHFDLLEWHQHALDDMRHNRRPEDLGARYLF